MNTNNSTIDEDEIDIKEVFRTIYNYRYMIISLVIIFTLASAVFAYFKPNVYQASSTVEISSEKGKGGTEDILAAAMDAGSVNVDTEIEIVKSVSMTQKALEKVDLAHHYYTTRRFKEVELYKETPFQVGMLKGFDVSFDLIPVDEKSYRLIVEEAKTKQKQVWSYNKIHLYGKEIVTEHFHLNVLKKAEMADEAYRFVISDPENIARIVNKNVSVSQKSKKASVLALSYTDNVALRAQEFTNALANAYVRKNIEKKSREAELKLTFIDDQLKNINKTLKASATKLEEFKKSSNTMDVNSKAANILQQMNTYQTQLTEISIRQKLLDSIYTQVKSGKNLEGISVSGLNMQMEQSALQSMITKLQNTIVEYKAMRQDYTEVHTTVAKLKSMIAQLKVAIIATISGLRDNITRNQVLLEKSIAQQQTLLDTLPADERVYGELQRKFVINEKIYSYLLEKQSEVGIIKASTVSQNIIIDKAFLPEDPIKPKRKLIVLVGLILGLILGIALAFLRAFLNDKIKSEEDVTHGTSVTLLGSIPNIKDDKEKDKIKVFLSPKSALAEAFRNLRTNLQFMPIESKSHVISVTSTVGGEGKTTTCINLGGIMSMAGKKTVVLNLDMRKPTLHKKFALKNAKGMSTFLSGRASLHDVIQHTEYENLDVITSGPVPPNPSELIQSQLMEALLNDLREIYDVIILDTPPVGLVTDARTLMHFADTSIYVLRADYSKKDFLRNVEKLSKEDIGGLTILLNDVKTGTGGYGYGYGYGYYEDE